MDWEQIKQDWPIIAGIITLVGGAIVWIKNRPRETAEVIKARAEVRRINREIYAIENKEIDELRMELFELRQRFQQALNEIEKLTRRLTVYETFKSSLKK